MNRIVFDHYPTASLPVDMRQGFEDVGEVRVTIETASASGSHAEPEPQRRPTPAPGLFSRYRHLRRNNHASDAEVDAYVRAMRDEWADHER